MSVLVQRTNGQGGLFVKGAPESVLEKCMFVQSGSSIAPLDQGTRKSILDLMASYTRNGLRTLALAYANKTDLDLSHYTSGSTAEYGKFEQNLIFVSLVGMLDPPRPEVRDAVTQCKAAGIRVICVTGDNQGTAEAICRQVGILELNEDTKGKSYTGREFDALTLDQKKEAVRRAKLFSRTEPSHKSQLVDLLQQEGLVVAMVSVFLSCHLRNSQFSSDW
jgi:P-type Ca2+ transporter type 2A